MTNGQLQPKPDAKSLWQERRERGLVRYLFFDGVIKTGGPFAVVMQAVGYFILRDEGQTFGQYFASPTTWVTFFLHATLFGLIIGYLTWRRNETAFKENGI
jgi:hypothetical protein